MAISVRDIQEKEFTKQKINGYSVEEVDDFLDEIAEQLGNLIRENMTLAEEAKKAAEQPAPVVQAAPAEPAYDEPSYFKNLELAMRETLISSQRIADETIAEARKKAQEIVAAAQEKADVIETEAKAAQAAAAAEVEAVRKEIESYRAAANQMLNQQQAALDAMKAALN